MFQPIIKVHRNYFDYTSNIKNWNEKEKVRVTLPIYKTLPLLSALRYEKI